MRYESAAAVIEAIRAMHRNGQNQDLIAIGREVAAINKDRAINEKIAGVMGKLFITSPGPSTRAQHFPQIDILLTQAGVMGLQYAYVVIVLEGHKMHETETYLWCNVRALLFSAGGRSPPSRLMEPDDLLVKVNLGSLPTTSYVLDVDWPVQCALDTIVAESKHMAKHCWHGSVLKALRVARMSALNRFQDTLNGNVQATSPVVVDRVRAFVRECGNKTPPETWLEAAKTLLTSVNVRPQAYASFESNIKRAAAIRQFLNDNERFLKENP